MLAFACAAVQAQAVLVGTYKGAVELPDTSVHANPRPHMLFVELEIKRINGNRVEGTWVHRNGNCQGSYPVDGMLRNGHLILDKHAAPDHEVCGSPKLHFVIEDGALVGKFAGGIRMTR